jgi:hypothetical protein
VNASRAVVEEVERTLRGIGHAFTTTDNAEHGSTVRTSCPLCGGQENGNGDGTANDRLVVTVQGRNAAWHCEADAAHDGVVVLAALKGIAEAMPPLLEDELFLVTFTADKTPKLILPAVPVPPHPQALAKWLTSVLRLDPRHPVTGAKHLGRRGQDGHILIARLGDVPALRFEPAGLLSSARRLLPALGLQLLPGDDEPYGFKDEHCRRLVHVVRLLAVHDWEMSEADETLGIVGLITERGDAIEGATIHGATTVERYALATALRQRDEHGRLRYLIDSDTGEHVIRVCDLQVAAREQTGSSMPHGWLDARMQSLGWRRVTLQGYARAGRNGRHGPHLRMDLYAGLLPDSGEPAEGEHT